jgi:hypothetical protein
VDRATIASVDKSDEAKAIATLVSAFIADPVERWLFAGWKRRTRGRWRSMSATDSL